MSTHLSRRAHQWARSSARRAILAGTALGATAVFATAGALGASASTLPSSLHGLTFSTVYTETNQVAGNTVLAYRAEPDGNLTPIGSYLTGGSGTGTGSGSQGSLALGDDGHLLAVVNGGSNNISIYFVGHFGSLQLIETVGSGGTDPISVTINGLWVYALNAGNSTTAPNISGFSLLAPGTQVTQPLSNAASSPEQVGFSPDGRDLVVTEKASNTIDVFPVSPWGTAGPAVTTTLAAGTGPYGFAFTPQGYAVISEAAAGALATFVVAPNGSLTQVSQVPDGQMAPCWVALSNTGQEAFTSNAHSGTVSAYEVAGNGALTLLSPAVQSDPGVGDTDIAVAGNSQLYISDQPNFDASAISPSGTLSPSQTVVEGLPAGTQGLVAAGVSPDRP